MQQEQNGTARQKKVSSRTLAKGAVFLAHKERRIAEQFGAVLGIAHPAQLPTIEL